MPHRAAPILALTLVSVATQAIAARPVRCGAGDVPCLVAAINDANANPDVHHRIWLEPGTYTLTDVDNNTDGPNGLPSIASTITIDVVGDGLATLIRDAAAPSFRIVHVSASGKLTLRRASVMNGAGGPGAGVLNDGGEVRIRKSVIAGNGGGGIANIGGSLTITDSAVANNVAIEAGGIASSGTLRIARSRVTGNQSLDGGGVQVLEGSARIADTTFENNSAYAGGGLDVHSGSVIVENSAFVGNVAGPFGSGAAIGNFGDGTVWVTNTTFARNDLVATVPSAIVIVNFGVLSLTNSTFWENTASRRTFRPGSTLVGSYPGGTIFLQNTILAHSAAESFVGDCAGNTISLGNNVVGDPTACDLELQSTDWLGDPGLGDFTDDGSPGNAHYPLLKSSIAVGSGDDAACPKRDQIGQPRRGQCDIGAIEFRDKREKPPKGDIKREEGGSDDEW